MIKKVKFELLDDFVSCGINTESNFLNTEDYISGAVMRAAFAKDIYLECCIDNRDYYIELKNNEICKDCKNNEVCRKFSDMTFSFFYLENTIPSPMTTKKCKIHPNSHPIKDILLSDGSVICDECRKENGSMAGRMEDAKGFINLKQMKPAKISKTMSTHTAINYAAKTAKEGSLFSINAICRGQYFEGYIDDCDTGLIEVGKIIYAGKYSSCGFGKMRIIEAEEAGSSGNIYDKIKMFTMALNKGDNKYYAPVLFLSNARLGIKEDTEPKTVDEYRKIWRELLFGENECIDVETVYSKQRIYRGYDTSKAWGDWQKDAVIETLMGTSILVSFTEENCEKAIDLLNKSESTGIGNDTKNGYGKIEVCNEIHMLGVIGNGY